MNHPSMQTSRPTILIDSLPCASFPTSSRPSRLDVLEGFDLHEPDRGDRQTYESRYREDRSERIQAGRQECEADKKHKQRPSLLTICAHRACSSICLSVRRHAVAGTGKPVRRNGEEEELRGSYHLTS